MECNFSEVRGEAITLDGKIVKGSDCFRYLGAIIQNDGELDGDMAHGSKHSSRLVKVEE